MTRPDVPADLRGSQIWNIYGPEYFGGKKYGRDYS